MTPGKSQHQLHALDQGEDKPGVQNSFTATDEKYFDNISIASEASESTGTGTLVF